MSASRVSSAANPLLKDVRRAIARGGLTARGWRVAESFHLLDEALRDSTVHAILAAESAHARVEERLAANNAARNGIRIAVLPGALFETLAATETSQGVIALVDPPECRVEQLFCGKPLIVILDGLQDPGNAGAIVRAAEAFGATGAMFLKGTVSPHNPKALRASAGSLFRLPVLHNMETVDALRALGEHGTQLFAAVPGGGGVAGLTAPCAIAIGNEARGVSPALRAAARAISIPTVGVESLNAAVAAGILLYEARRQRTAGA